MLDDEPDDVDEPAVDPELDDESVEPLEPEPELEPEPDPELPLVDPSVLPDDELPLLVDPDVEPEPLVDPELELSPDEEPLDEEPLLEESPVEPDDEDPWLPELDDESPDDVVESCVEESLFEASCDEEPSVCAFASDVLSDVDFDVSLVDDQVAVHAGGSGLVPTPSPAVTNSITSAVITMAIKADTAATMTALRCTFERCARLARDRAKADSARARDCALRSGTNGLLEATPAFALAARGFIDAVERTEGAVVGASPARPFARAPLTGAVACGPSAASCADVLSVSARPLEAPVVSCDEANGT